MKQLTLLLLFSVHSLTAFSQDYSSYYELINQAEEQFIIKRDSSCFALYDKAFASNKPFLKDPYIASQIAFNLGDTSRFYHYLNVCFSNGMPATAIDAAPMLRSKLDSKSRLKIEQLANLCYKTPKVDSALYERVCMWCYQSDSIKMVMGRDPVKVQQFYAVENEARDFIRDSLLKEGIYANEHLIPITSEKENNAFFEKYNRPNPYSGFPPSSSKLEYELRVLCPNNIVLHSYCFFQANKEYFFEAMKRGYLHPKEYGIMEEISIMWYKKTDNLADQCEPSAKKICYNILGFDPTRAFNCYTSKPEEIELVEQNRKAIYLQSFAIDEAKKKLEKELGFAFFFDFINRQ